MQGQVGTIKMQQNCFSVSHFAFRVFEFKSLDIIHLELF